MNINASLHSRLRNCLQTILELNDGFSSPVLVHAFMQELDLIRNFLLRLDAVELQEEDVLRIEKATEVFLNELRGLFATGSTEREELSNSETPTRLQ